MRKYNKSLIFAAMITAAIALIAVAANYKALTLPETGEWRAAGIGIGKLAAVRVDGAYPADGTVIISRITADGAATNALLTVTASGGTATTNVADTLYLIDGDRLLRTGTATNTCQVLLILE